jgi:hypothetical protein
MKKTKITLRNLSDFNGKLAKVSFGSDEGSIVGSGIGSCCRWSWGGDNGRDENGDEICGEVEASGWRMCNDGRKYVLYC